ncbi:glycoside hydrolase family 108 protein [Acetomicrobium sp. S15 = DSM 107314]|uniref:glycoside hydrolase family 108 protein n=1 Tax=Acetomicrobium sp. S15 = DSM 107314 TaxID=2529858 RepID=UPI0018E12D28|nr:glycosyl hydrolase 108 family protein [Acetomicrobium sp. S15 = DSM 107314]
MRFEDVFRIVLNVEGGYSNNPDDRGGETNLGVTEGTLRSAQAKGWVSKDITIKTLKTEHARIIYKKGYWDPIRGDLLPEPLDLILFDCAINHGPGGAVKLLQEALNSILVGTPLVVDGALGPKTFAALVELLEIDKRLTDENPNVEPHFLLRYLCVDVLMNRTELFDWLVDRNESQQKFLRGWIHQRVVRLAEKAGLEQ